MIQSLEVEFCIKMASNMETVLSVKASLTCVPELVCLTAYRQQRMELKYL